MTSRTLYVYRPVLNADDIIAWAKEQGFGTTLLPDDLHVTVAYSKEAFDLGDLQPIDTEVIAAAGNRAVKSFGDGSVTVLAFESDELSRRWQEIRDAGASWSWPDYAPHVTITYQAGDADVGAVEPYDGPIHLGPEQFAEIADDWSSTVTEKFTRSPTMRDLQMFIPITKVDAAKRLVYGVATAEMEDRSGEICDYAGTKPLYEKWSGDIAKATDGKSLGNVRAMHGKVAAGKVTGITFNDEAKQIEICAKVVDDAEWNKVEEGVYTGFSQGGQYVKRWKDEAGLQRYIADPVEVSLVDVPCLPTATFQMIKADGVVEEKPFKAPEKPVITNDQVAAKAKELAKAAGDETKWADHLEPARVQLENAVVVEPVVEKAADPVVDEPDLRSEVEQVWKSKDGQTFKTKADAVKHAADLAKAASAGKPLDDATAALAVALGKSEPVKADVVVLPLVAPGGTAIADKAALVEFIKGNKSGALVRRQIGQLAKQLGAEEVLPDTWVKKSVGLWTVADMAALLGWIEDLAASITIDGFWIDSVNVDDTVKARFAALLTEFGDLTAEVLDAYLASMSTDDQVIVIEAAAQSLDLFKAGARHSKADKANLQKAHDALVSLGADCGMDKAAQAELAKGGDLAKVLADNAEMKIAMDKAVGMIGDAVKTIDDLTKKVADLEKQPMLGGAVQLQVVGKEDESLSEIRKAAETGDLNAVATELIKQSFARPMTSLAGQAARTEPAATA